MGLLTQVLLSSLVSVVGHAREGPLRGVETLDSYLSGASGAAPLKRHGGLTTTKPFVYHSILLGNGSS